MPPISSGSDYCNDFSTPRGTFQDEIFERHALHFRGHGGLGVAVLYAVKRACPAEAGLGRKTEALRWKTDQSL